MQYETGEDDKQEWLANRIFEMLSVNTTVWRIIGSRRDQTRDEKK